MSKYGNTNPFEDEEDEVDDETFLKNSRRNQSNSQPSFDEQIQNFQERRKEIENRTVQSTERSINILRDSEQIGIATAEELMRQREQLERTDKRLDEINASLRFSQKHINGIKSVFSSLKNYMSGKSGDQSPSSVSSSNNSQVSRTNVSLCLLARNKFVSYLQQPTKPEPATNYNCYDNHPVTRMKTQDAYIPPSQSSGSKDISAKLDANLQEMCSNISRLKGLATDLSFEIDSQNDLIGTITDKTERADLSIAKQNKDMNRILKK